ncbi:FtsK/SpoIIIE domain-containing protein [uncultured Schumannella sp.]|uniref:FtsK/SpoIIIE domain-containing protein n=1 Tax=uncultured Schumannella sp. TaxID=1195956 RepID=UPI002600F253|nr:FtsK/SpoIIIE domain-containing protein [uncultured Schumannella sp.]
MPVEPNPETPTRRPLPTLPSAPPRAPFPVAMAVIPVVLSLTMWLVTGSALVLVFAALGPLAALANVADGWRQRRRATRRDAAAFQRELAAWRAEVDALHAATRARLARARPSVEGAHDALSVVTDWHGEPAELPIVIGLAEVRAADIAGEVPTAAAEDALGVELAADRERARRIVDASVVLDARGGVGIAGPEALARAHAREVATQIAARLSPRHWAVLAPADERWTGELPHAWRVADETAFVFEPAGSAPPGAPIVVRWVGESASESRVALLGDVASVVRIDGGGGAELLRGGPESRQLRVDALTQPEARARARALTALAERHDLMPQSARLPEALAFDELPLATHETAAHGLAAVFAVADSGPIEIDLDRDGPHALIAGTTGAGKSEALVSWVLALCASHTAREVAFVLIDFKGGSTFGQLDGVPHVAGIVTDLDAIRARRAMRGLRAELERRERLIAECGARSIAELPPGRLPRLVVAVDEYATVVTDHPELHAVFSDLAARGRSLGVHLILCTQRPTGVVREGILANVTLKIALRVTDRAESMAVLGTDSAARLAAAAHGRAILKDARGEREIHLALSDRRDVEALRRDASPRPGELQPWSDPLPAEVSRHDLDRAAGAASGAGVFAFGLLDRVELARHERAAYAPAEHGALLVTGAPRSGRTSALATLAEEAERLHPGGVIVVPPDPVEAWARLEALGTERPRPGGLIVIDDLDVLLDSFPVDQAAEFVARLGRLVRESARTGTGVVLAASRVTGATHGVVGAVSARLILRQPSREEHILAGLPSEFFTAAAPPGSGWWHGVSVQVARPDGDADRVLGDLAPRGRRVPETLHLPDQGGIAVVTARVRARAAAWRERGWAVRELSEQSAAADAGLTVRDGGVVLIGDADDWNASWALLAVARRELRFLVDASVSLTELRHLTRVRAIPPPLAAPGAADEPEEWWLVEAGEIRRVRLGEN